MGLAPVLAPPRTPTKRSTKGGRAITDWPELTTCLFLLAVNAFLGPTLAALSPNALEWEFGPEALQATPKLWQPWFSGGWDGKLSLP